MGSYRADLFVDAEIFATQLVLLFDKFEIEAVEYLTDIRNSACIQRNHKFPPSLEEISTALEEESIKREQVRRAGVGPSRRPYVPPPRPTGPGCRANVLVRTDIEWYKTVEEWALGPGVDARDYRFAPEGIWIALDKWLDLKGGRIGKWKQPTLADIGRREAEYQAAKAAEEMIDATKNFD